MTAAEMSDREPRWPVVVGVAPGPEGQEALRLGLREAAWRRTEAVLVRAWNHSFSGPGDQASTSELDGAVLEKEARVALEDLVASVAEEAAGVQLRQVVCRGEAGEILVGASHTSDLLVVGSRGYTGARALLVGSVSLHCALHAGCPVMVVTPGAVNPLGRVRDDGPAHPPSVVVGFDGSLGARAALGWAIDEARRRHWPLKAVSVWHQPEGFEPLGPATMPDRELQAEAEAALAEAIRQEGGAAPDVPVEARIIEGSPHTRLLAAAGPDDILVLGSRGHGGFAGLLLGSVVEHALGRSHCPLVVVHGRR